MPLIIIFFLIFSENVSATDKYISIFGAGAEDQNKTSTMFDPGVVALSPYVNKTKFKEVNLAFDGGHRDTEVKLKVFYPKQTNKNFTNSNIDQAIASYISKIEKGIIKSGDQILISIDTHGAPQYGVEKTHQIATVASNKNANYDLYSMDRLKKLMEIAKAKNIKLGILDLGCFSGNTQNLNDGHACIVSATSPELFSYKSSTTFSALFFKSFSSSDNLEEAYLKARLDADNERGMPMISTRAGQDIYQKISKVLNQFVRSNADTKGRAENLQELIGSFDQVKYCDRNIQFNRMMSEISRLERFIKNNEGVMDWLFDSSLSDLKELRELLLKYKSMQDDVIRDHLNLKKMLGNKVSISYESPKGTINSISYSYLDMLGNDFRIHLVREKNMPKPNTKMISLYEALIAKKNELVSKKSPMLKGFEDMKKISKKLKGTEDLSEVIAAKERILYDRMYRKDQDQSSKKNNPCRDFKL
jgi:hypothetical protein